MKRLTKFSNALFHAPSLFLSFSDAKRKTNVPCCFRGFNFHVLVEAVRASGVSTRAFDEFARKLLLFRIANAAPHFCKTILLSQTRRRRPSHSQSLSIFPSSSVCNYACIPFGRNRNDSKREEKRNKSKRGFLQGVTRGRKLEKIKEAPNREIIPTTRDDTHTLNMLSTSLQK